MGEKAYDSSANCWFFSYQFYQVSPDFIQFYPILSNFVLFHHISVYSTAVDFS